MHLFGESVGDGIPLSAEFLTAYNKDYSKLFELTKHSTLSVVPVYTPEHAPCGKALVLNKDYDMLVAKITSNGKLMIFDKEMFEKEFTVNRLEPAITEACFVNLMEFFKSINIINSYQKFNMHEFISSNRENYGFKASRDKRFFMDTVFGNTCTAREIHVGRVINVGTHSFFEQMTFNFFKSFKITVQRYKDSVRFDFAFKQFNAHCVVSPDDNSRMVDVFKLMAKAYLDKMSIYLDDDYLFTQDFFDYYEQITAMIEI